MPPSSSPAGGRTWPEPIEALRNGADAFVVLPEERVRAAVTVKQALEKRRLRREARDLRDQARSRLRFVGSSPDASVIEEIVRRAAPTKATVLLQGEAGSGRSFVAEMIHEASPRRERPFARAGCAGLSENLLEVHLFGSDGGQPGEAPRRREGLLERVDGGTLYLHEVGGLSPSLQVKLLRLLQQGEYERVGGSRTLARRRAGGGLHPARPGRGDPRPGGSATTSTTG